MLRGCLSIDGGPRRGFAAHELAMVGRGARMMFLEFEGWGGEGEVI
jgi:hypothetical protein